MVMEVVCPAGTPAALRAAVKAGADTVYCGYNDETNARNFPGLNFDQEEMREGVAFAHAHGSRVLIAINTFPRASNEAIWHRAVADAEVCGADAVILADPGLLDYAMRNHPGLRRHLSVQAAAANADIINYCAETFDVKRVVLPRVLSVQEIAAINVEIQVETEVFVFGGLCVMAEERCSLSSYVTGLSPNMNGVTALKIEGRQRSRSYVAQVVRNFRAAVDAVEAGRPMPEGMLARLSEGQAMTTGAYKKTWR